MVVSKPAPLIMHPTGKKDEITLLGLLQRERPEEEFYLVNRLDRETSGCVLVATSKGVARQLGKAVARREVRKGYSAVVHGWPGWDEFRVDEPLRRQGEFSESEIWVRQAVHEDGKGSVTSFKVRKRWRNRLGRFALVDCQPETGRTHQIRVHLKWTGHGIVGDKIYAGDGSEYLDFLREGWSAGLERRLLLDRQALHAESLSFSWEGETVEVTSPLPEELESFCIA